MIEFTKITGGRIAIDKFSIYTIEELSEQCSEITYRGEEELRVMKVMGSFTENMEKFTDKINKDPDF